MNIDKKYQNHKKVYLNDEVKELVETKHKNAQRKNNELQIKVRDAKFNALKDQVKLLWCKIAVVSYYKRNYYEIIITFFVDTVKSLSAGISFDVSGNPFLNFLMAGLFPNTHWPVQVLYSLHLKVSVGERFCYSPTGRLLHLWQVFCNLATEKY